MPKVSVVLPTYNGQKYLKESIDSIINQTFNDWELIIVNDCSTDSTLRIAKQYEKKDKRIHVYTNKENLKLPKSLNEGFSHAKGEYLTWTSDDNRYKTTAFKTLVSYLDSHHDCGLVYADMDRIDEAGIYKSSNKLLDPQELLFLNPVGACFMYRKSAKDVVGDYDADMFLAEDYDYWMRIYENFPVTHIRENLYDYRDHGKSLTATRMKEIVRQTAKLKYKHLDFILKKIEKKSDVKNLFLQFKEYAMPLNKEQIKGFKSKYPMINVWYILRKPYQKCRHFLGRVKNKLKRILLGNKIEKKVDYLKVFNRATDWIERNALNGESIIVNSKERRTYPEVTGYYIPTLLLWGYKDMAVKFARHLCKIQKQDGSWHDPSDSAPYIFDTAQILKGLTAIYSFLPEVKENIRKGCDWILSNMQDSGRLVQPDMSDWGNGVATELIHTYCLSPLIDASKILGDKKYEKTAKKILAYYKAEWLERIENFNMLSHFYAYVMEALVDMGEIDLAKLSMSRIARIQHEDGMINAYANVDWTCSTGMFQLALVWFKLGELELGTKTFDCACKLQNKTGGWYGSYPVYKGVKNTYFPDAEISWANKYFLDALYWKSKLEFEKCSDIFLEQIDKSDGRYKLILNAIQMNGGGEFLTLDVAKEDI